MGSPLDRPIWSALTTRQRAISLGGDRARRLPADMAPFADVADTADPADLKELAGLVPAGDFVVMFTDGPVEPPAGLAIADTSSGDQMVLESLRAPEGDFDIAPLTTADVPAMQELVRLTNPGPFGPRTVELGRFVGIRAGGRLAAMAGERLKPEGYTEITGVCTHPEHRGRGLSQALVADVARHILGRGDTPCLHVYSTNASAVALYAKLGFRLRRSLRVTILRRPT
jgi:ribosomal protein S18 acetylase RimI-like enzyme